MNQFRKSDPCLSQNGVVPKCGLINRDVPIPSSSCMSFLHGGSMEEADGAESDGQEPGYAPKGRFLRVAPPKLLLSGFNRGIQALHIDTSGVAEARLFFECSGCGVRSPWSPSILRGYNVTPLGDRVQICIRPLSHGRS